MDDLDLRRMFDQIAPTQEQEVTMLDRLHRTEREEQTMKRGMKRGLVALVAAALMMTAAFAVAAGLDQRLMDYFGIGQEDLTLVSNGIVQVDKTHAYKNGWTVEVKQLLFDRYCGEILVDLTAPEGTVLTEQDYRMDFQTLPTNRDLTNQGWGGGIGGEYLPESSDLAHGRISMLLHIHLEVASGDLLGIKLNLTPEKLGWWGLEEENDWEFHTLADFREESWTVKLTIPEADPGRTLTTEQPLNIAGYELPVKQLYVSPISFLYDVSGLPFRGQPFDGDTVDGLMAVMGDEELTNAVLTMTDGSQVTMAARYFCQISHPAEGMFDQGRVIYRLADIIDPNQVSSDTFCQGCLRTFFAVIQNQTLDFVAHGFFARFTEMDFDAVGGLSDFLYHYRWRGFLYGQRGSGCGGAAVAGVVVHRLSFP